MAFLNGYLDKLDQMSNRRYRISLFFVVFVALILRLGITDIFVGLSSPPNLGAQPDQYYYETIAYNLATGKGYTVSSHTPTAFVVPGTSLTLLPIYVLWGRSFFMGRLWFCFLSALTCLGVALTVLQIWTKTASLVAATMMAFYPNHFYYAMHFVSETPYAFYLSAGLAFTVAALRKRSIMLNVIAGCFWGAAALTRAQLLLLIPLAFLFVFAAWRRQDGWSLLRAWGIQSVVVMLILCPWLIRNKIVIGSPVLSTFSGHTFFYSHNDLIFSDPTFKQYQGTSLSDTQRLRELYPIQGKTELERDQQARQYALQSVLRNFDKMPKLIWASFVTFINPLTDTPNRMVKIAFAAGWIFVGMFSLLGLWAVSERRPHMAVVILLPILVTLATCLLFHAEPRYRDSASPAFVALAAIGFMRLSHIMLLGLSQHRAK